MEKVSVRAQNGEYDILIGEKILSPRYFDGYTDYAIVTDDNVYPLYSSYFPDAKWIVLPAGEESKTIANFERILNELLKMNIDRKGAVGALGGGVVGDIAGFAAACYKRGISYIQLPTTLLAQVDSSVGGKVAVDLPGGKNMVGAFYQPACVVADISALSTLDARQYAAGMAEVIKYGYIFDRDLHDALKNGEISDEQIVKRCCEIKSDYVRRDPFDKGDRMQLNYGHTIGHALETAEGYGGLLHGEAIAIGMALAAKIGERVGIAPIGLEQDTIELLIEYGLPYQAEPALLDRALELLHNDKKAGGEEILFVLIDRIGHAVLHPMRASEIQKILRSES